MKLLYFTILIGALIFFHELGHFLAAKAFGIKVLRFALGFGKPLVTFTKGETTYAINMVPLGGYVKMLGQEPAEMREEEEPIPEEELDRAFDSKPRWQRFMVIVAGPVFNLVLPIPIYFSFLAAQSTLPPAAVGEVIPDDPAWEAGLRPGDRIVGIDGIRVDYWEQMEKLIARSPGRRLRLTVERAGRLMELEVTPAKVELPGALPGTSRKVGRIGITSGFLASQVGLLDPSGIAASAGLEPWDLVIEAGGRPIRRWVELERVLGANPGRSVELRVRRLGPERTFDDPEEAFRAGEVVEIEVPVPPAGTALSLGMVPGNLLVAEVEDGSAAARAGVRVGDLLWEVDSERCASFRLCLRHVRSDPRSLHHLTLWRPGEGLYEIDLQPDIERSVDEVKQEVFRASIGMRNRSLLLPPVEVPNRIRWSRAIAGALDRTWFLIEVNTRGLVMLLTAQIPASTVGGPIMIFDLAGKAANRGLADFMALLAVISINLGLINLLPIPILDGGQMAILGIEAIKREPLSMRARIIAAYLGLAVVVALMVFAFKNDIERYWGDIVGWFQ